MTNLAIAAILEHLCNEARNSAHATFGVLELLRDLAPDSVRESSLAIGSASADQLLRSIDDVRELLSSAAPAPGAIEQFDLALCAGEIVEVLNLASARRAKRMILDAPSGPVLITQDRKAVDQVLTRVLGVAFELATTCEVRVALSSGSGPDRVRLAIAARDAEVARRLAQWLNANLEEAVLQEAGDVPFGIAVMVAGKRMRVLGGAVELVRDSAGHSSVVLELPSRTRDAGAEDLATSMPEAQSGALNILVAEDCDDSFALTALALPNENVWRARDGRDALRMIQKQRFDVVFMDVHMPGMDGYSAIRKIRDWETQICHARTPMIVLSSDDLETQRRSAAQSGCSGFLRKPMRSSDLARLLSRLKASRIAVSELS
jgi:CheY-like chemotaxis protein